MDGKSNALSKAGGKKIPFFYRSNNSYPILRVFNVDSNIDKSSGRKYIAGFYDDSDLGGTAISPIQNSSTDWSNKVGTYSTTLVSSGGVMFLLYDSNINFYEIPTTTTTTNRGMQKITGLSDSGLSSIQYIQDGVKKTSSNFEMKKLGVGVLYSKSSSNKPVIFYADYSPSEGLSVYSKDDGTPIENFDYTSWYACNTGQADGSNYTMRGFMAYYIWGQSEITILD